MKEKIKKYFYCSNLAWYAEANKIKNHEIMIGYFNPDTEYTGEFVIRWIELGNEYTPKLEAFNDSWKVLLEMPELISALAIIDGERYTQREMMDLFLSLGYENNTAYQAPEDVEHVKSQRQIFIAAKKSLQAEIDKIDKILKEKTNE